MSLASWMHDWDDTIAGIGADYSNGVIQTAAEAVETSSIRRFCEAIELDCAIHYDATIAKTLGYRDLVAPASSVTSTFADAGLWQPGDATVYPSPDPHAPPQVNVTRTITRQALPTPPTSSSFATDIRVDFFEPVCIGDRIRKYGNRLLSVSPKETRVGRGAFLLFESDYSNQRDQLVARRQLGVYMYNPHREVPRDDSNAGSSAHSVLSSRATELQHFPAHEDDGTFLHLALENTPRSPREFRVGDTIPPLSINLTVHRLVVFAGANRDFAQIHHDSYIAQRYGAPDMFANNVFCQAIWERAARRYMGMTGRIRTIGPFRIRQFNTVGDTMTTIGSVKTISSHGNECYVELELTTTNSNGTSVGPGRVVFSVPQ